jgi:hypothetical protein
VLVDAEVAGVHVGLERICGGSYVTVP